MPGVDLGYPASVGGAGGSLESTTWLSPRHVALVVVLLSCCTGSVDALSFMRFGEVFASVMTGNMVLLGVSIGRHDASLAVHAGFAFLGYISGTALGARLCREGKAHAPSRLVQALCVELAALIVLTALWEGFGVQPGHDVQFALAAVAASAMGIQGSFVRSLPATKTSTIYLTGTLSRLVSSLSLGASPREERQTALALGALVVGAAGGATLVVGVPRAATAIAVVALLVVLGVLSSERRRAAPRRTSSSS